MRNPPRHGRLLQAAVLVSLLLAAPPPAFAGDPGVALFFDAFTSFGRVDEYSLHAAALVTEPDPLKERGLAITGGGNFHGGGFHLAILGEEARGGFGVGIYGIDGLELKHDALPPRIAASVGSSWGMNIDVFLGKELAKKPVVPYVDLRATFNVLQAGIELRHPDYGVLGETPYNAYSFGIGPRLGVSIPLSDPWVIDISGYYGLFGAERVTLVASFGFWDR